MPSVIVTMASTTPRGLMPLYLDQLYAADIDHYIHEMPNGFPNMNAGGNVGFTLDLTRQLCTEFSDYDFLIKSCAHDVLFLGSKEKLMEKLSWIPSGTVLLSAERNCYPETHLCELISNGRSTPWIFANGGFIIGRPADILRWTIDIERHPLYNPCYLDQLLFNRLLAEQSPLISLDYQTHFVYNLFLEEGELAFDKGRPINSVTGNSPLFLHFNGKWPSDPTLALYHKSLEVA